MRPLPLSPQRQRPRARFMPRNLPLNSVVKANLSLSLSLSPPHLFRCSALASAALRSRPAAQPKADEKSC
jgi:hypothetical protein